MRTRSAPARRRLRTRAPQRWATLAAPLLLLLVLQAAGAGFGRASTVQRLDLPQAMAIADQVVLGRVTATRALWSDDHLRIYTDATLEVEETLKGRAALTVQVRLIGGHIGDIGQMAPGAPSLSAGEEALLLLQHLPGQPASDPPRIVGLAQGLYRIDRAPAAAQAIARRDLTGLELIDVQVSGKQPVSPPVDSAESVPLDALLARVRALAAGGGQ